MNADRRKRLQEMADKVTEIREDLDALRDEEEQAAAAMPDNFGEKKDKSAELCGHMEEAIMALDEAYHNIDDAKGEE